MKNGNLWLWKLLRDIVLVAVAVFMLVHETLSDSPQDIVLAAALVLLGVPAALRIDDRLRKNGEG